MYGSFGVFVVGSVLDVAWELFENDSRIAKLSQMIDEKTNVNQVTNTIASELTGTLHDVRQSAQVEPRSGETIAPMAMPQVKVTYFFSWFFVLLLLYLISRIGLGLIAKGGELALFMGGHEKQTKKLLREQRTRSTSKNFAGSKPTKVRVITARFNSTLFV